FPLRRRRSERPPPTGGIWKGTRPGDVISRAPSPGARGLTVGARSSVYGPARSVAIAAVIHVPGETPSYSGVKTERIRRCAMTCRSEHRPEFLLHTCIW